MTSESSHKHRLEARRRRRLREITNHLVLLLVVFLYSFVGAKLFQSIEEKHEQIATGDLVKSKQQFLERISVGVGSGKLDKRNWTLMVEKLLGYYVEDLAEATTHGVDITDVNDNEYQSARKWDFWGSLFYAGTVYTTIGYGNFAPVTTEGKIATIIYGTIGIPLCLILLAEQGNLIAKLIKHGIKKVKKRIYSGTKKNVRELWPPQDEIDTMTGRSSFVVLCVISLLYLFLGAYMYKTWEEGWTYLDAVYFIFVSTSTIGFGDVLPTQPKKFIYSSLYVFFGLSLLSTGFTILQELLEKQITDTKGSIDSVLGIEVTEYEKKQHEKQQDRAKGETEADAVDSAGPAKDSPMRSSQAETTTNSRSSDKTAEIGSSYQHETRDSNLRHRNVAAAGAATPVSAVVMDQVVEESVITPQTTNNNSLSSAPTQQFNTAPLEASSAHQSEPGSRWGGGARNDKSWQRPPPVSTQQSSRWRGGEQLGETRVISQDDHSVSVEATIILDN